GSKVDPSILSGGIWVALLTTAVGLTVAIPAVTALNLFESRLDVFRQEMRDVSARLIAALHTRQDEALIAEPAKDAAE
ncbi:MAG TPA: flagellar motor protein MotA, partial [Alphaproteobacteria bacterium]|nr:flagellar motor protein MotA [Alphaproteobacteria bacterium]